MVPPTHPQIKQVVDATFKKMRERVAEMTLADISTRVFAMTLTGQPYTHDLIADAVNSCVLSSRTSMLGAMMEEIAVNVLRLRAKVSGFVVEHVGADLKKDDWPGIDIIVRDNGAWWIITMKSSDGQMNGGEGREHYRNLMAAKRKALAMGATRAEVLLVWSGETPIDKPHVVAQPKSKNVKAEIQALIVTHPDRRASFMLEKLKGVAAKNIVGLGGGEFFAKIRASEMAYLSEWATVEPFEYKEFYGARFFREISGYGLRDEF